MTYDDMSVEQQYFYDLTWENLRLAYEMVEQGRKAKAQELMLEVRFYAQKVPKGFTDNELEQNITKLYRQINLGF